MFFYETTLERALNGIDGTAMLPTSSTFLIQFSSCVSCSEYIRPLPKGGNWFIQNYLHEVSGNGTWIDCLLNRLPSVQ